MYFKLFGREYFAEIVPLSKKLLDWYSSLEENHIWFGPIHVVWNRTEDNHAKSTPERPEKGTDPTS